MAARPLTAISRERALRPVESFQRLFHEETDVSHVFLDVINRNLTASLRQALRRQARLAVSRRTGRDGGGDVGAHRRNVGRTGLVGRERERPPDAPGVRTCSCTDRDEPCATSSGGGARRQVEDHDDQPPPGSRVGDRQVRASGRGGGPDPWSVVVGVA